MTEPAFKLKADVLPKVFSGAPVPPEVKKEVQSLYGPRPLAFVAQLAFAWVVIVSAIAVAVRVDAWWMTMIAIFVVASRQVVFGLLTHDQAHKLGLRGQKGDALVNLFASYPLLAFSVETYAKAHLSHHKYYFTDKDPDHHRKSGPEWRVPLRKRDLAKMVIRDLTGFSILQVIKGKNAEVGSNEFLRSKPTPKFVKPLFLLAVAAALTVFHMWMVFLIYWIVPILTVLPVLIRWGALSEHIYETEGYEIEENSPLIMPTLVGRLIMPNLNFTYHAYHHWHPAIAFSNLPKAHEIYVRHGLVDESKAFRGSFAYLKYITRKK